MPAIPGIRTALLKDAAFALGLEGLAVSHRVPVVLQPSGVAELDAVLGGGFPRGSLVELCGPASSGRTSLSLALLAEATQREEACAFVDVSDSLDPMSLAAAGVDIRRLLWIRCGGDEGNDPSHQARPTSAASLPKEKDAEGSALLPSAQARKEPTNNGRGLYLEPANKTTGFLWQHPRNQMRGIETSIPSLVRGETGKNGNGAQQQHPIPVPSPEIHIVATCAGEQVEPDRQRPRREENVRRLPQKQTQNIDPPPAVRGTARRTKPWKRLEQALKATDLLLHSGGWGVVVFDLGSISWMDARRIPLSTWFRFQRIVENTPTILLVLGEEPCAKSCASLVLRCQRGEEKWSSVAPANGKSGACCPPAGWTRTGRHLFTLSSEGQPSQNQSLPETRPGSPTRSGIATFRGFEIQGKVVRSRRQLQPANSARWQTRTLWSGSF